MLDGIKALGASSVIRSDVKQYVIWLYNLLIFSWNDIFVGVLEWI
jgi:hypothetical protein